MDRVSSNASSLTSLLASSGLGGVPLPEIGVAPPSHRPSSAGVHHPLDPSPPSAPGHAGHPSISYLRPYLPEEEASIPVGGYGGNVAPFQQSTPPPDGQRRSRALSANRGPRLGASTPEGLDGMGTRRSSHSQVSEAMRLEERNLVTAELAATAAALSDCTGQKLSQKLTDSYLLRMGPAAAATTMEAPSEAFQRWWQHLQSRAEERLLHEARRRFTSWAADASLHDFRRWLSMASCQADEASLRIMRRMQLRTWLLVVGRRRSGHAAVSCIHDRPLVSDGVVLPFCVDGCVFGAESLHLPNEVRDCIEAYIGGKHVWGPISATRARAVSEAALRPIRRCEEILHAAAVAALAARYVHPYVVQAAEAGHMQCYTEIPTDDIAMRALFEGSGAETHQEIGTLLAAHLKIDGFEVEPKYHDPEYGLWRGFWVEKCNRLRLTLMW